MNHCLLPVDVVIQLLFHQKEGTHYCTCFVSVASSTVRIAPSTHFNSLTQALVVTSSPVPTMATTSTTAATHTSAVPPRMDQRREMIATAVGVGISVGVILCTGVIITVIIAVQQLLLAKKRKAGRHSSKGVLISALVTVT